MNIDPEIQRRIDNQPPIPEGYVRIFEDQYCLAYREYTQEHWEEIRQSLNKLFSDKTNVIDNIFMWTLCNSVV